MHLKLYERAKTSDKLSFQSFNYIPPLIFLGCTRKFGQTPGLVSFDLSMYPFVSTIIMKGHYHNVWRHRRR